MAIITDISEGEDELYEHYAFRVVKGQQSVRVDKYLMNFMENVTRSKIQKFCRLLKEELAQLRTIRFYFEKYVK